MLLYHHHHGGIVMATPWCAPARSGRGRVDRSRVGKVGGDPRQAYLPLPTLYLYPCVGTSWRDVTSWGAPWPTPSTPWPAPGAAGGGPGERGGAWVPVGRDFYLAQYIVNQ